MQVDTKECSALSDIELESFAQLSADGLDLGVGVFAKEKEKWVYCTQVHDQGKLESFIFHSLERISGTPSLVVGVGYLRDSPLVVEAAFNQLKTKMGMIFPDEDVLVIMRVKNVFPLCMLSGLSDLHPLANQEPDGEQRALGRRIAKHFSVDKFDDTTMVGKHSDHDFFIELKPEDEKSFLEKSFKQTEQFRVNLDEEEFVLAWGWVMHEMI